MRRIVGSTMILCVFAVAAGVMVSLATAIYPERVGRFDHVYRKPYTHAFDPIALATLGLPPDSIATDVPPAVPEIRVIKVLPDQVQLVIAGSIAKRVYYTLPPTDLRALIELIDDPDWISEPSPGHVLLDSALVTFRGVEFKIGSPEVQKVSMVDRPSVFIGTRGGVLQFSEVIVTTEDPTAADIHPYQPYVLATDGAEMNATNSVFTRLGWDWNASYGVSWEQGPDFGQVGAHRRWC